MLPVLTRRLCSFETFLCSSLRCDDFDEGGKLAPVTTTSNQCLKFWRYNPGGKSLIISSETALRSLVLFGASIDCVLVLYWLKSSFIWLLRMDYIGTSPRSNTAQV